MKVILLTLVITGLAIAAIAIKMFLKKGGEFTKSCSGTDPDTGERIGCTCGKGDGGEQCGNR